MRSRLRTSFVLTLLLAAAPWAAEAGWASLGAMGAPKREGRALVFQNAQGTVAVSVVAADIVRVRFSPTQALGRDHSYAIASHELGDATADFETSTSESRIRTSALTVVLHHDPLRVSFADAAGASLDEDDPARGIAFVDGSVRVWKRLRDDEHVYGLGEKTGRLDKRGRNLGGTQYTMWNSDTYGYGDDTDPIYVSIPFFMVLREGRAHGIFLDNTYRSSFDVGHESQRLLAFGAEGGELDYYFIAGPEPKRVVQRYADLTGHMPLPPRWALGYHQCRYSYYPESKVRSIADNFRTRHIPADVIWLDIHYQQGFKPFTWDHTRFPDPPRMIADLRRQGFRVVTIVDPHLAQEPGAAPYDSGLAGDHFVKAADGSIYKAPVWPASAEKNPLPSVFPDFSRPATREWWGSLFRMFTDIGVAGIWNDMNEPATFVVPARTMPPDVRHDNEGQPTDHREIHNVYGMLMSRGTYEGLARLRPNERPFVLTRATYAGGQRWAAQWPGDNVSDWAHLRATIPMFGGMGISGLPFVGADIGGFVGAPSPELFTRWIQAGVFYPFMRVHTELGSPDQEPWSYGPKHEAINRRAIERRYELLPHVYNVMHEASVTGVPAFRALLLEYPDDPLTYDRDDEFLFGEDLLVAPVLNERAREREVYLPKGDWYALVGGRRHEGGRSLKVPVTLEDIPIFVRGGAFLFRQPVVQHTGEMAGQPLIATAYPAARSEAWLYEDDGASLDYQHGVFARRRFAQRREGGRCTIEVGAVEGSYRPAARDLVVDVVGATAQSVSEGDGRLPRLTPAALDGGGKGWTVRPDGRVSIRMRDRSEPFSIVLGGARVISSDVRRFLGTSARPGD
jgi:alpha-glucosidase